jgi:hypothetical protein
MSRFFAYGVLVIVGLLMWGVLALPIIYGVWYVDLVVLGVPLAWVIHWAIRKVVSNEHHDRSVANQKDN